MICSVHDAKNSAIHRHSSCLPKTNAGANYTVRLVSNGSGTNQQIGSIHILANGPADFYVNDANPNVGKPRIVGIASHKPDDSWVEVTAENLTTFPDYKRHPLEPGTWVLVAPDSAARMRKFYFQHLDVDGRKRLIGLVNAKTINFGEPGYFYPLPFFMKIAEPEATQPTEVPK